MDVIKWLALMAGLYCTLSALFLFYCSPRWYDMRSWPIAGWSFGSILDPLLGRLRWQSTFWYRTLPLLNNSVAGVTLRQKEKADTRAHLPWTFWAFFLTLFALWPDGAGVFLIMTLLAYYKPHFFDWIPLVTRGTYRNPFIMPSWIERKKWQLPISATTIIYVITLLILSDILGSVVLIFIGMIISLYGIVRHWTDKNKSWNTRIRHAETISIGLATALASEAVHGSMIALILTSGLIGFVLYSRVIRQRAHNPIAGYKLKHQ